MATRKERKKAAPRRSTPPRKVKAPEQRESKRPRPRTSVPPPAWSSRCRAEPWPFSAWPAENKDVAAAQDAMLMAYWIADQLGDPGLPDTQRRALRSAVGGALPFLRGSLEGAGVWAVASAVRRNGAIMVEAQRSEQRRLAQGAVLDALLEAHEDDAAHLTIQQVELHSPELASWMAELERRKRPELRNALKACGAQPWRPAQGARDDALRRLLVLVSFAVEQAARSTKFR